MELIDKTIDKIINKMTQIKNSRTSKKRTSHLGSNGISNKVVAGVIAVSMAVGAGWYAITDKWFSKTDTPDTPKDKKVDKKNPSSIAPNLSFDPNSDEEMINRISNVAVDALSNREDDITVEQWIDTYTVLNIKHIEPSDYSKLQFNSKTKESIMRNFDYVMNTLLDATIVSEPSKVIDISDIIADEKSAEAVKDLQQRIAIFNTSDKKSTIAKALNGFVSDEFATEEYNQIDAASNLVRFKLLLAMDRMTVNNSYRVPTTDMSKIIFGDKESCDIASDEMINTKYNGEKTTVKETLETKLEKASELKISKEQSQAVEALTGYEIQKQIEEKIAGQKIEKVAKPTVKEVITKTQPKDPIPASKKVQPTDTIKTDEKTGEQFVAVDKSKEEKQKQREDIAAEIKKENEINDLKEAAVRDAWIAASDAAKEDFADGKYDDDINLNSGNEIYNKYYNETYKKRYKDRWEYYKQKENDKENNVVKEKIEILPEYDKNNDNKLDEEVNDNNPEKEKVDEKIDLLPGYYYDEDGVLRYKEPVEEKSVQSTTSRAKKIQELKALRTIVASSNNFTTGHQLQKTRS